MLLRYIQKDILIYIQLFRMYKSGTRNTYVAVPYNPIVRSTQDVRTSIASIHSTCENQYQYINTTRRTVHSPPASTTNRKATNGKHFQEVYVRGGNWPVSKHTLLQNLSTPSDHSVSDNGCIHQMALKKNSVREGVIIGVSGWKRLPWRLSEK
jgi:hypothetical protein